MSDNLEKAIQAGQIASEIANQASEAVSDKVSDRVKKAGFWARLAASVLSLFKKR